MVYLRGTHLAEHVHVRSVASLAYHMSSNDMELFFLSLLLLFVLFISLSLHFLVYKRKSHGGASKLPLGTTGFPVLGETLEFLSTGRKGIPEKFTYDRMAKFSREVFKSSLFGESFAIFCGPQGNKFLYSNENKLVTSWWPSSINKIFPNSSETSVVDESKKMRKVLPSSLKPEALQRYVGIMDTIAQRHFKAAWENKEEVMVFPLAKRYTFWLACRLFLSVDDPEHVARFAEPFNAVASGIISMPINFPGTPFNRAIKAANVIRKELGAIIKQRKMDLAENRASAKQDVLSHMLLFTDDSGRFMNEIDVANKILALLIGGHDTASASITFIMKYLAELPDVYEQVLKEQTEIANSKAPGELLNWDDIQKMKYSWNVACEVMRLAPPLQGGFREAITDFTYSGFSIPKGWKLYWTAHSTHRNPEYFPEPEKFDPSRFEGNGPAPYTFVPFGGGPRMCPGKEYARLEILVFMYHVVRRFKWQKVLPNEKIIVDPMPVPAKGLPIHLQAHKA